MADLTGQQLGNYRLIQYLGRGASADVYLGEHVYLKSYAALKVLHTVLQEQDIESFLTEAQILVGLRHPNIVRVLEFIFERKTPVLVMDYAPGGTARQLIPKGSRLPLATTVAYVEQVANALQYAHNHNLIHRDVKPENILFDTDQHILLSDFGLALFAPSPELLSTHEWAGTIPYIPPEQFKRRPTFASDQYALGIITYEWLCGVRPFEGEAWAIINQHLSEDPTPLRNFRPDLPAEVENVVLRALSKDPRQRFTSMQAFSLALARASRQQVADLEEDTRPLTAIQLAPPLEVSADSTITRHSPQPTRPRRVFLTAAPADESFAGHLQADLEARGVIVSRASEDSTLDLKNQDALRYAVRDAHMILVVVSPYTRSSRTIKEHLRVAGMYQQRMVFVRAEGDDLAATLPEAWGRTAMIDLVDARGTRYRAALNEIMAFLQERIPAVVPGEMTLPEATTELRNPYKGLHAFTKDDASDFFGRDTLIVELAETIEGMLAAERPTRPGSRLLTVIGPSGSGKSSVVMAGLLPTLQNSALPGSETWVYLPPMVPGEHPLEALVLALEPHLPRRSLRSIREDLEDDSARGLHLLATRLLKQAGTRVVLTIDQFEELFTLTPSEWERQRFIDLLVTAVTEPVGPLIILLTLRADFYDRPMEYPQLSSLVEAHQKAVLPMNPHELRSVIERHAALPDVQVVLEDNVVGDLLFEAQGQIGALPLLEFTLDQLFRLREGRRLTNSAYRQIGGVKGALAKHAESTYNTLPSEEHRRLARALFLRLIDPGATEQDTTRRRANLAELSLPDPEKTTIMREVADAFVEARLLTMNVIERTTTIEVSHEALIREWVRLAEWLRQAREDILRQQTISADAADWVRRGKPPDRVYQGTELAEALSWAERNEPSREEEAFLAASVAEQQRQEAAELSRQARELKLKRQTVTRLRWLVAGLTLFLVASIVFSTLIQQSLQENTQLLQIARSRALAANAIISLSQNELDRALLLSVKANLEADTYEARNSLLSALEYTPHIVTILRQDSPINVNTVAIVSNDGTLVSSDDNAVTVWNTKTMAPRRLPLDLVTMGVRSTAVSPDGRVLVTSSSNGVESWNIQTGSQVDQLDGKTNTPLLPTFLAFSWNGQYLASGRCHTFSNANGPVCTETDMIVWDMQNPKQQIGLPCAVHATVNSIALSPDGMTLAYGSDKSVGICNMTTGVDSPLVGSTDANSVVFSPDGKLLASGGNDKTIRLWDARTRQPVGTPLVGQAGAVLSLAFSRNSNILISGSQDQTIWEWDVSSVTSGQPVGSTLVGSTDAVGSLAFSPTSNMLASGSVNGIILLWNIDAASPISQRSGQTGGPLSAVFSSDGKTLFTGNDQGEIFPYDVTTRKAPGPLDTTKLYPPRKAKPGEIEFLSSIRSLALSKNGTILAIGRQDGTILLWNTNTRNFVAHLHQTNLLQKIALSPDGQTVASVDDNGTIILWNVAKLQPSHTLAPPGQQYQLWTRSLAISRDGKTLAAGGCAKVRIDKTCAQGQIALWNVATGQPIGHPLLGQPSVADNVAFSDVALSPDGQTLAAGSQDGIVLWNISTGQRGQTLTLPVEKGYSDYSDYYDYILFNADGKLLASYSQLGPSFSFVLWDVAQAKPLAHAFHFPVTSNQGSVAFSPDGQRLASVVTDALYNNTVSLWDITIPAWQQRACAIANRNLYRDEWSQFLSDEPYGKVCQNLPLPPASSSG